MGFAEVKPKKKRESVTPGLIACQNCPADFDPSTRWVVGYIDSEDTSSDGGFVAVGEMPEGVCPVCRTPYTK